MSRHQYFCLLETAFEGQVCQYDIRRDDDACKCGIADDDIAFSVIEQSIAVPQRYAHIVEITTQQIRYAHSPTACVRIHKFYQALKDIDLIVGAVEVRPKM